MKRNQAVLLAVVVGMFIVGGYWVTTPSRPDPSRGLAPVASPEPSEATTRTVRLSIATRLQRSQLVVDGTTDLPDGAVVRCEASYQGRFDDNVVQNYKTLIDLGKAAVAQQAFSIQGDVGRLPPGRNKAYCAFLPAIDEQPQHVSDAYGRTGQHLSGANVYGASEVRTVEAESFFEKR